MYHFGGGGGGGGGGGVRMLECVWDGGVGADGEGLKL